MLTEKQEKFIQNIVKGMSQREAYKNAYDCENMSDNAIDREASLLMKSPKITQRHKELGSAAVNDAVMTAQERLEYLTRVVRGEELEHKHTLTDGELSLYTLQPELNTRLKAIDLMNKMTGEYVTKVEGSMNVKLEDLL